MALIHKLFQHSRDKRRSTWGCGGSKKDQTFESPEVLTSYKCWQAPVLEDKQIRLLIFKECDVKGKKVIVDSKAIHKVDQQENVAPSCRLGKCSPLIGKGDGKAGGEKRTSPSNIVDGYQFSRPGSDVKMLGEMIFGATPMSSNSPMIKVHTFKIPPKLMLSRMFLLKPPKEQLETDGGDKDSISLCCADMTIPRSISANSLPTVELARSLPIAMPPSPGGSKFDDESGDFSASGSFLTPFPSSPGSSVSSSASNSSLHRRWLRNQVTSMENMVRRRSSENINSTEEPIRPRKRYPKIGVAILFSLPEGRETEDETFRRFFFSHFSLLESHFQRLISSIERALIFQRKNFIKPIMEALSNFKLTVTQLFTAPRIQQPIWLNLMTYPQQRGHLCTRLIRELGSLLDSYNSKQNNFFMSRLMTGVLMHHLAWVPTVMPAGSAPSRAFLDKHSSTTLDMLAKSHPYNPLWAQLGDMYGTIGLPNRVAKTVVVGKRIDVVCKLLYVLSYFIRCSELHEVNEKCEDTITDLADAFPISDAKGAPECHRRHTEESSLAKTEDSGFEEAGLLQSGEQQHSTRPVFYLQGSGKLQETLGSFDEKSTGVETSIDDGVGVESEEPCEEGAVKQLQRIQRAKCNNNVVCSEKSFEDDECAKRRAFEESEKSKVFHSETEVDSFDVSGDIDTRTLGDIDSRTAKCVHTEVESQSANSSDDSPVIMCKKLDTTILTSKIEVAMPVGRALGNIDDFLRFDVEVPVTKKKADLVNCLPSRNLQDEQSRESCDASSNSANRRKSGNSSPDDDLRDKSERTAKSCSEAILDLHSSTNSHKVLSESDIIQRTCQMTSEPESFNCASTEFVCKQCAGTLNASSLAISHTSNTSTGKHHCTCTRTNCHTSDAYKTTNPSSSCPSATTDHCGNLSNVSTAENLHTSNTTSAPTTTNLNCLNASYSTTTPATANLHPMNASTNTNPHTSSASQQTLGSATPPILTSTMQPLQRTRLGSVEGNTEKYDLYHRSVSSLSVVSCASSGPLSDHTCLDHEEIPLASSEQVFELELERTKSHVDTFGRSLLGGYCQHFVPDFALQGVPHLDHKSVEKNLLDSAQHPVLEDVMSEAVYVIADTDNWSVEVVSCERYQGAGEKPSRQDVVTSNLIVQLLESVKMLQHMKLSSDFCLMHLENQLQEVYFQSASMASYLEHEPMAKARALGHAVGVDCSDLPLLLAVASVHSPHVIHNVMRETIEQQRSFISLQEDSPDDS